MGKRSNYLNRVTIAKPCSVDWDRMRGDDLIRFCDQCDKYVHNLSMMTTKQAEALLSSKGVRICARFERLPGGGILTQSEPGQLSVRPKLFQIAGAALVTALSLNTTATAHTPLRVEQRASIYSGFLTRKTADQVPSQGATASLLVTIFDVTEAVIVGARISLINEVTGEVKTGITSEEGEHQFTSVEAGSYTLKIEAAGFRMFTRTGLVLGAGSAMQFGATLQVGTMGEIVLLDEEIKPTPIPETLLKPLKALKRIVKGRKQ